MTARGLAVVRDGTVAGTTILLLWCLVNYPEVTWAEALGSSAAQLGVLFLFERRMGRLPPPGPPLPEARVVRVS